MSDSRITELPVVRSSSGSTSPPAYDQFYYQHCCGMPYVRTQEWLRIFGGIADHIKQDVEPTSVLDAGCAMGFLVECLRNRGIEAFGVDISEYAIQRVREDMQPYCWIGSLLDPLPRTYDLIVCIEVLEHLTPRECDQVVGNFSRASDDILFSSTPEDYREATHINVRPPDYWAGLFARHGFYRDVDFDASFITAWAMRFRKAHEPVYRLVEAYERRLWHLTREATGARDIAYESRLQLAERDQQIAQVQSQFAAAQAQCAEAQAQMMQAQAESQQSLAAAQMERQARQQLADQITEINTSPGWRFVTWIGHVRQHLFPAGSRRERGWFSVVNKLSARLRF
jgi:SAM-dependent methyltransferase